jgi:hypothetical protein
MPQTPSNLHQGHRLRLFRSLVEGGGNMIVVERWNSQCLLRCHVRDCDRQRLSINSYLNSLSLLYLSLSLSSSLSLSPPLFLSPLPLAVSLSHFVCLSVPPFFGFLSLSTHTHIHSNSQVGILKLLNRPTKNVWKNIRCCSHSFPAPSLSPSLSSFPLPLPMFIVCVCLYLGLLFISFSLTFKSPPLL